MFFLFFSKYSDINLIINLLIEIPNSHAFFSSSSVFLSVMHTVVSIFDHPPYSVYKVNGWETKKLEKKLNKQELFQINHGHTFIEFKKTEQRNEVKKWKRKDQWKESLQYAQLH